MSQRPRSTLPAPQGAPSGTPHDDTRIRKEAVAWYARLCSGSASAADQAAWQRWHRQHPDHQRAWQRIEAMRLSLQQVPAHIAAPALRGAAAGANRSRRQALRSVLVLASAGSLGYLSYRAADQQGLVQPWLAQHHTGIGEQRSVLLADGSLLLLNTDSAADVRFSGTQRLVRLWAGEILIETARHRQPGQPQATDTRPFVVRTMHGSVLALGTRFTVRQLAERTDITVLDDAVELRALDAPDQALVLRAGQCASLTRAGISPALVADDGAASWQSGHLLVNDRSLGEVVAELARYRRGHLACDATVAGIRISGTFPLADTDRALTLLSRSFPLRVRSLTRYWVTLGPR